MATRTDGPSLNGALAQAGRLLALFSILVSVGLLLSYVKIDRLEVVPYALPFRQPYVTARGRLERRELALVRLHADGLVGIGETAALVLRGGDPLAAIVAELERCGALLVGSDVEPERWAEPADRVRSEASAPALAAIEIALLDLAGKAAGAARLAHCSGPRRPAQSNATPPSRPARPWTLPHRRSLGRSGASGASS